MEFITFFFIVLWGALNSYLAQQRGRNPYLWFFLGIMFGPFPLIVLFLLPKGEKSEAETVAEEVEVPETLDVDGINISHHAPFDQHDWYYLDKDHKQHGPHTYSEMRKFARKEEILEETYVWNESMPQWQKIKDLPELGKALKS